MSQFWFYTACVKRFENFFFQKKIDNTVNDKINQSFVMRQSVFVLFYSGLCYHNDAQKLQNENCILNF